MCRAKVPLKLSCVTVCRMLSVQDPDSLSCSSPGVSRSPFLQGLLLSAVALVRHAAGCHMSSVLVLQLQLSPVELSELHADLKIQERDEFSWKKLKAEGLDEDGEKEAKLIRNLNGIFPFYFLL